MAFNCYLKQVPSGYSDMSCAIDGDCLKLNYLTLLLSAMYVSTRQLLVIRRAAVFTRYSTASIQTNP
jgi:hypothetical protein